MVGTEKPASGYDKRTMANDIRALLQHLEIEKVSMIGHDRGARVATRFAKDHPAMLDRLVVMDNIPTRIIFQRMNAEVARGHWFFIFNNVPDLPEALISEREEIWLRYIVRVPDSVQHALFPLASSKSALAQDEHIRQREASCAYLWPLRY